AKARVRAISSAGRGRKTRPPAAVSASTRTTGPSAIPCSSQARPTPPRAVRRYMGGKGDFMVASPEKGVSVLDCTQYTVSSQAPRRFLGGGFVGMQQALT